MDSDADWSPLYDLYAYSRDGKPSTSVSLHYRVNLSQGTGENWDDAKLVLSTSDTGILNAGIPESVGIVVEPKPKPKPPQPSRLFGGVKKKRTTQTARAIHASLFSDVNAEVDSEFDGEAELEGEDESDDLFEELTDLGADVLPEMSEGGAVISKSPMAVNYTVDNLTTIPSNDESHKVLVATIPLEASVSHITTPRESALAYLQVRVVRLLVSHFTDCIVTSSAPSTTRASIPFFLESLAYSSTIHMYPKRRYLGLRPETLSAALSGWTHRSRSRILSRRLL